MNIVQLKSEHVKRLRVVEITPKGDVVVIGGKNGQGKSSVLDSIEWALGGDPDAPLPVHKGQDKARTIVDLGDIVVQRTFSPDGSTTLVVKNKDGVRQSSPQALLDSLVGNLTFDPLAFSRLKPEKQGETLRKLVGLDFTAHDTKRQNFYDSRTNVNRDAKALESQFTALKHFDDAPETEQLPSAILEEQRQAAEQNRKNAQARAIAEAAKATLHQRERDVAAAKEEIARLEKVIEEWRKSLANREAVAKTAYDEAARTAEIADACKDIDLSPFGAKLTAVELGNQKLKQNQRRASLVEQFKAKTAEADKLTAQIEKLDAEKRQKITDAKYPIDGLQFDAAGGVTYNGIPFEQCSSAEQLRVSVAVAIALNPKLRVLLIRDGSLLDEDSLKLIHEMAATNKMQVWIERVGEDAHTSVVIEDGAVK